jgi:hypothetical protein
VYNARPASPPTIAPLKRMNCRSLPTLQLIHVPGFDLIGDERGYAALVIVNEALQHHDHAAIDMRTQSRIVGELAAGFDQKPAQMCMKYRVRIADALFEEAAKADPHALREVGDTAVGEQVALEHLKLRRVFGRASDFLDE